MKLGVICDGISRDLAHALNVMDEFGLDYAELQFVWDKEVGDHDAGEIAKIKDLLDAHNKPGRDGERNDYSRQGGSAQGGLLEAQGLPGNRTSRVKKRCRCD